jgi:hypothetical protein
MILTIYIGNTTILELQYLTNSVSGEAITTATVIATLTDSKGEEVVGQTWPVTLTHVDTGTYRATLENDLTLVANRPYTATIDATLAGVGVGHWVKTAIAIQRT